MLEREPAKRITAAEALKHPYFQRTLVDEGADGEDDAEAMLQRKVPKIRDE